MPAHWRGKKTLQCKAKSSEELGTREPMCWPGRKLSWGWVVPMAAFTHLSFILSNMCLMWVTILLLLCSVRPSSARLFLSFFFLSFFLSFFLISHTQGTWELPGQEAKPSHISDLCHSWSNAGSLTHCDTERTMTSFPELAGAILFLCLNHAIPSTSEEGGTWREYATMNVLLDYS